MEEELGMDLFDDELFSNETIEENNDDSDDSSTNDGSDTNDDPQEENENINGDLGDDESQENVAENDTEGEETSSENDDTESDDSNSSPNLYKSLATVLFEQGVIPSVESSELDKTGSVDDLVSMIQKQVKANEFSELNDVQKEYLEALKQGLPPERFDAYKRFEEQLDSISEDHIVQNEELRKQLIYRDFKSRGFTDEKASKMTERSFNADEDVEDAKAAYEVIKAQHQENKKAEIAAIQKQKDDAKKASEDEQKEIKKLVFDTNEIIKGYEISDGVKKKMYSKMMNPVSKNPETGVSENELMKYQRENKKDFMHKLYYLFTVTNNFKDFSYFENKSKSNSVKELEDAITKSTHVTAGGDPSFLDDNDSKILDIGDILIDE